MILKLSLKTVAAVLLSILLLVTNVLMIAVPAASQAILGLASQLIPTIRNPWRELDSLATEVTDLRKSNTSIRSELATAKKQNAKLLQADAEHRNRFSKLRAETDAFGKRLTQRLTRNIGLNTGAVLTESVPILGVAVVVGTTAMDVNDACDTVNDMNTLFSELGLPENTDDASEICGYKKQIPSAHQIAEYWLSGWGKIKRDVNRSVADLGSKMGETHISLGGYLYYLVERIKASWSDSIRWFSGVFD